MKGSGLKHCLQLPHVPFTGNLQAEIFWVVIYELYLLWDRHIRYGEVQEILPYID
jgi:hypothetical protein